jgi:hypothetical protein
MFLEPSENPADLLRLAEICDGICNRIVITQA